MVQCCVLGCRNRTEQGLSDVTFHRFPSNAGPVEIWIQACGRYDWRSTRNSRICSKHFKNDLFIKRGEKNYLKPGALPTNDIYTSDLTSKPGGSDSTGQSKFSGKRPETLDLEMTRKHDIEIPQTPRRKKLDEKRRKKLRAASDLSSISGGSESSETQSDIYEKTNALSLKGRSRKRKVEEVESPRKKKLRKIAATRLKKLRAVRQAKRRLLKRNAELTNIISELRTKSLLSYEDAEFLNSIDTVNRDFLRRFLGVEHKNTRYSPSLRKFALCLHFLSPRAYSYVREQFNTCLPHPQTLTNWYRSVDGSPGFTKESLAAIKLKSKGTDKKIYVSVSFDEMAIRKSVTFSEGDFFGTVNFGSSSGSDDVRLAKQSLVFMATAINDSWKIPVGYFLIDNLSGEQKAELIKSCVQLLTQSGVEVVSVTCDGCPSNFAMARILGCEIDSYNLEDIKTDFKVDVDGNQKSIVFYPDPPHMLKLIRNILGDKGVILNDEGEIKWEYIKNLHNLQDTEGLHLGNKLRKAHIDFSKQIMKVKLAAQTFSSSVADAIDFCRCELKLPEFENSACTTDFVRKINNLFDILNSRNINAYGLKKPLNKKNFDEISSVLNYMLNYLNNLKFIGGQKINKSNRKTSIIGFSCNIRSILCLYERLVETGNLIFLPSYKLCQDHLESFFSAIRAKGGFNNNPSPVQFKAAYKRLVVHGELKHVATGNCTILENIDILTYTHSRYEKKINSSLSVLRDPFAMEECESHELNNVSYDHDYLPDPGNLTEYSEDVIAYIAGFVVTKISKIIKCGNCLQSAIDASKSIGRLISKKNKGGLCFPSKDVVDICLLTEKVLKRNMTSLITRKNARQYLLHESFKICSCKHFFKGHGDIFDCSPLDNHELLLTKAIIWEYLKVRLHYVAKRVSEPNEKIRNIYSKLILFKNQ